MSTTAVVFLAVIAAATLVMAVVQVGLIIVSIRLAGQMQALGTRFEEQIKPLLANVTALSGNAVRVSESAVAQFERAERAFADVVQRIDETSRLVQGTILAPVREGRALLAALGAILGAVRGSQEARRHPLGAEDDDPLFIG